MGTETSEAYPPKQNVQIALKSLKPRMGTETRFNFFI